MVGVGIFTLGLSIETGEMMRACRTGSAIAARVLWNSLRCSSDVPFSGNLPHQPGSRSMADVVIVGFFR